MRKAKLWCVKCGSINHTAFDCSAPKPATPFPAPDIPGEDVEPEAEKVVNTNKSSAPVVPEPTFDPPRWPGGPHICNGVNLPAFPDAKAAKVFQGLLPGVSSKLIETPCQHCGEFHLETIHIRGPSGDSSGTGRENTKPLPGYFKPFESKKMRASAFTTGELPVRHYQEPTPAEPPPREPPPKKVDQKARPKVKPTSGNGELF